MLADESHRNLERVWQIGRQGEELGPLRRQALLQSPTRVSSGFMGGTLGSLAPTTSSGELPAVPGSQFIGELYLTCQHMVSLLSASRLIPNWGIQDPEVGGYLESRSDEVRRRLPGKPPRSPLIDLYERRLNELRERLRSLESARITNAAATNRARAMVDESWLGARLLASTATHSGSTVGLAEDNSMAAYRITNDEESPCESRRIGCGAAH